VIYYTQTLETEIKSAMAQYRERGTAEIPAEMPAGKWTVEGQGKVGAIHAGEYLRTYCRR